MKTIQFKDYIVRYLDYVDPQDYSNRKDTLVMLHGLGASAERWLRVVPTTLEISQTCYTRYNRIRIQ